MKTTCRAISMTFGAGILTAMLIPSASAGCGDLSNWRGPIEFALPSLVQAVSPAAQTESALSRSSEASIVGMWSVQFVSQGNTAHNPSIPDGAVLDFGYQLWHSDGTEWMNSGGRAPSAQNFCEGVYGKTGFNTYELNHFAFSYDATSGANTGTANIREQLTLSPSGNSFSGSFTIDAYDIKGNHVDHVGGTITGTRITVDTTVTAEP